MNNLTSDSTDNLYIEKAEGIKSLNPRIVLILAISCGITVANIYWAQPLLDSIAHTFGSNITTAGLIITLTQIGYVIGLVFLVPLGDILERRKLIVIVLLVASVSLISAAFSPTILIFMAASLAIGVTSVVAQILVPFSATLALEHERGKVVGQVMSGLLLGILLARTLSGIISASLGWRYVFGIASVLVIFLSFLLSRTLPKSKIETSLTYPQLLKTVWDLVKTERLLRIRSLYGMLVFASFSVLWTSLTFLLAHPPYNFSDAVIGLFGLIGASGAASANIAGRIADKGYTKSATGIFLFSILASFLIMVFGKTSLVPLIIGIIIFDFAAQGTHILNQGEIYKLKPEARSRLTTAYITSFFIGGSIGSATSAIIFSKYGWVGVCMLGEIYSLIAISIWIRELF
ncbi:MAG: MFS transporter [Ignavibacteriaceae bacterium]|jgi:predicted MFS family arabinose efflux permease